MAKTKKQKNEAARTTREADKETRASAAKSKSQAEMIAEYRSKMQTSIRAVAKALEVTPLGFDAPKGTKGAVESGSLTVDLITGGGFPKQRMTTVAGWSGAGKTTLLTKSEGIQLKKGLTTHHLDLEGAVDYTWMLRGGTDVNEYLGSKKGKQQTFYYVPDFPSGDASFRYMSRILDDSIKNGASELPFLANIFYQDSLPACIPESLLDNDEAGSAPRLAIMLSEKIPMVKLKLRPGNSAYIAVNQVRENPRQMFGCLHGDTKIRLVDGRVFPIRDIVDQKIQGEVWSYDDQTGTLQPRRILNWYDNGTATAENWLSIETEGPGSGRGSHDITVTKAHKLLALKGKNNTWVAAQELQVGDQLTSQAEVFTHGTGTEFLLGAMTGDAGVNEFYNKGALVLCNKEQPEYLEWKVQKLSKGLTFKQYEQYLFVSKPRVDLDLMKQRMPERNPLAVWDRFTSLSLAVWYMDDGCYKESHQNASISVKRFKNKPEVIQELASRLSQLGYECSAREDLVAFTVLGFKKLSREIARFVPICMQYKLNPEDRGQYQDFELTFDTAQAPIAVKIRAIREMSRKKARSGRKFDLEIEGTHNYVACSKHGGLVVHNSPEYEPGGNAPEFYADVKLRLERIGTPKALDFKNKHPLLPKEDGLIKAQAIHVEHNPDETIDEYFYTQVKTTKNRVFPPLKTTYFRMWVTENGGAGRGIDPVWDVIRFNEEIGQMVIHSRKEIIFKGKTYTYFDLKDQILGPKPAEGEIPKDPMDSELYLEARSLLESGEAFERYFSRLRGDGGEIGKPDSDE